MLDVLLTNVGAQGLIVFWYLGSISKINLSYEVKKISI